MKGVIGKIVIISLFVCGLTLVLFQTALAAEPILITTKAVTLRADATTGSSHIETIAADVELVVISHDPSPEGWTRVNHNKFEGYVKSEYLTLPEREGSVTFRTTSGVNLRVAPSADALIIRTISSDTDVEVLEHEPPPNGWSRISFNGYEGYVRSVFLAMRVPSAQQSEIAFSDQMSAVSEIFDIPVSLSEEPDWDELDSSDGSDSWELTEDRERAIGNAVIDGEVELLHRSDVRNTVKAGMTIEIIDITTGITFNLRASSVGSHIDSEPITQADTDALFEASGGEWSWVARPVWAIIDGRVYAAALPARPHAGNTVSGNGMNGHLCLHFDETTAKNKSYEADLRRAVTEAWEASV